MPTANTPNECDKGPFRCKTDNATFQAYLGNLGPVMTQETTDTLLDSYDTTDLNVDITSNPVYTGSAETDLIYHFVSQAQWPGGGNAAGLALCDDAASSSVCDQFYIYYQAENVNANINDNVYLQKLACHETGHGAGLVHASDSWRRPVPNANTTHFWSYCMRTGDEAVSQLLGQHNAWIINANY